MKMKWKQLRPELHCKLFSFMACDTFDGLGTLMFIRPSPPPWCPCVALRLKSSCQATVMRNPHPSTTRDHLGIGCCFASLFHVRCLCAPSVCRFEWRLNDGFPLRTWHITLMPGRPAGWEKTAAARHSSQPHQSLRKADVTALSSLKNLFADISSFCHTAERRWLTEVENMPNVRLTQIWWIGVCQNPVWCAFYFSFYIFMCNKRELWCFLEVFTCFLAKRQSQSWPPWWKGQVYTLKNKMACTILNFCKFSSCFLANCR